MCLTLEKSSELPGDESSIKSSFASFNGWILSLKPIVEHHSDDKSGEDQEALRASQIWIYRYDCICNLLEPSICLDGSQAILSIARLSGNPTLQIEAEHTSPDDKDYVLKPRDG